MTHLLEWFKWKIVVISYAGEDAEKQDLSHRW